MIKVLSRSLVAALACACPAALALSCGASATAHAFGIYYPMSGNVAETSSGITVSCSGLAGLLVSVEIHLGAGNGSYDARRMLNGAYALNYNLYMDAARSRIWGDGTGSTAFVSYTLLLPLLGNNSRTDQIYGRVPASQYDAVPGNYTDSIVVTVEYFGL